MKLDGSKFRNSCKSRRGCEIIYTLPHDSRVGPISGKVYGTGDDIKKGEVMVHLSLHKELAA